MATKISKALAQAIRVAIVENTLAGFDKDGKPFNKYSDKPFAMPAGAVSNKTKLKQAQKKSKNTPDPIVKVFTNNKTGGIWITWMGGYKDYKTMMGHDAKVNLSFTGGMLKSFGVLKVLEQWKTDSIFEGQKFTLPIPEIEITLGWQDKEKAKIAYWNKQRGRDILGLPYKKLNPLVAGFLKSNFK